MQYTAARPGPEKLESDDFLQISCDNEHYEFTWTRHHALSSILRKNSPWLDFSHLSNIFIYIVSFFLPLNVIQTFIKFSSFKLRDQRHQ